MVKRAPRIARQLLLISLIGACEARSHEAEGPDEPSSDAGPTTLPSDPCAALEREAVVLWRAHQRCERDSDCTRVKVEPACLDPLVCEPTVSRLFDVTAFQEGATEIALRYRDCVGDCGLFECAGDGELACDPVQRVCTPLR